MLRAQTCLRQNSLAAQVGHVVAQSSRVRGRSRGFTWQALAGVTAPLSDHWDVGVVGNVLVSNGLRTRQYGLGLELGYLISTNLWLSAGYNVTGFTDNDLAGADYTNRGLYLRLRFKFDEDLLKGGSKPSSATVSPASAELRAT